MDNFEKIIDWDFTVEKDEYGCAIAHGIALTDQGKIYTKSINLSDIFYYDQIKYDGMLEDADSEFDVSHLSYEQQMKILQEYGNSKVLVKSHYEISYTLQGKESETREPILVDTFKDAKEVVSSIYRDLIANKGFSYSVDLVEYRTDISSNDTYIGSLTTFNGDDLSYRNYDGWYHKGEPTKLKKNEVRVN